MAKVDRDLWSSFIQLLTHLKEGHLEEGGEDQVQVDWGFPRLEIPQPLWATNKMLYFTEQDAFTVSMQV